MRKAPWRLTVRTGVGVAGEGVIADLASAPLTNPAAAWRIDLPISRRAPRLLRGALAKNAPPAKSRGGGGLGPPPPQPTPPGGGDGSRSESEGWGAGHRPAPWVRTAGGGDGCRRYAPFVRRCRAEARRTASLRPTSPASAPCACRPCWASRAHCAHRRASATFLPADLEDDVADLEAMLGSEPVGVDIGDDHAFAPLPATAGGREREAEPRHVGVPARWRVFGCRARWPRAGSAIRRASARGLLLALAPDGQLHRRASGAMAPIWLARSRASLTGVPLTAVITSPAWMPALAAGLSACGSATSAPSAS